MYSTYRYPCILYIIIIYVYIHTAQTKIMVCIKLRPGQVKGVVSIPSLMLSAAIIHIYNKRVCNNTGVCVYGGCIWPCTSVCARHYRSRAAKGLCVCFEGRGYREIRVIIIIYTCDNTQRKRGPWEYPAGVRAGFN